MPNTKFYFIENYLLIKIHIKDPQCLWDKSQTSLCCLCLSSLFQYVNCSVYSSRLFLIVKMFFQKCSEVYFQWVRKKNEQKKSQQLSWPVGLSSPLFINDHLFASVYYSLWVCPAFPSCKHPGRSSLLMKTQCFIPNAPATQLSQQGGSCLRQCPGLPWPGRLRPRPVDGALHPRDTGSTSWFHQTRWDVCLEGDPDVLTEANKWNVWT